MCDKAKEQKKKKRKKKLTVLWLVEPGDLKFLNIGMSLEGSGMLPAL